MRALSIAAVYLFLAGCGADDTAEHGRADTSPAGDTADAEDGAVDTSDPDVGAAPACGSCELGARRCDGSRIVACVEVAQAPDQPECRLWAVEVRCNRFATCQDVPEVACRESSVDPDGFDLFFPGASDTVLVHDLVWDGAVGTLTFSTARDQRRVLGVARFDAAGPLGAPVVTAIDAQEASLAAVGERLFVHWRGSMTGNVAELAVPGLALGEPIDATARDIAQNLHAFGTDDGAVLFQTSVSGGSSAWLGWLAPDAPAVEWTDATPRFDWNRPTAAAIGAAGGGFDAVWLGQDREVLTSAHFSATGARIGGTVDNVLPEGAGAVLGLVRDGDGALVVWSGLVAADERGELWVGRLDALGALDRVRATGRADTDFGAFAELAGADDGGLWVAFPPTSDFATLVLARLARDGALLSDRVVNSVGGGKVRVAGGRVANCWGVPYEGVRCAVTPAP